MITSILAPTDLSARSDLALRRAFKLAAQHGASITICHMIDDAAPYDLHDEMRKSAEKTLSSFAQTLKGDVPTNIKVDHGDPTADILSHISDLAPDLVVMGTHRTRPFLDALRETTVQRIARLTTCPVLMVADTDTHDYKRIVAAIDFSPAATAALSTAHRLAPQASITPVHAFQVPFGGMLTRDAQGRSEITRSFRTEAKDADRAWRSNATLPKSCDATSFTAASPYTALADYVRSVGATLITAGAHGRVGGHRALLGSLATDLLRQPPCDILIARP